VTWWFRISRAQLGSGLPIFIFILGAKSQFAESSGGNRILALEVAPRLAANRALNSLTRTGLQKMLLTTISGHAISVIA
jgi:hypothetical protein